ncbi:MAG: DUF167 domain-containing protein [Minisyncoccales bacterium]
MLIKVKTLPCSKEEAVVQLGSDAFKVSVRDKPENGAANARAIELLALYFAVPAGKIHLIKGARESHKIFEILD